MGCNLLVYMIEYNLCHIIFFVKFHRISKEHIICGPCIYRLGKDVVKKAIEMVRLHEQK